MADIKFNCVITAERYYSSDSSWGVFVFNTDDNIPEYTEVSIDPFCDNPFCDNNKVKTKMSTLAGNMQQLYVGTEYAVTATLEFNKKYNSYQYKPKIVTAIVPKSIEQQDTFLRSIITDKQADVLLKEYPNIVDDIVNNRDNVDLSKLKGIGEATYKRIKDIVLDNYIISDVLTLLQPLGVNYNTIKRLLMGEPNPTLLKEKLISDPYIILNARGFGWKSVDQLALKINPDIKLSSKRVYAFIKYFLKEIGESQGHTWVSESDLQNAVRDNINECMNIYNNIIQIEKQSMITLYFDDEKVGLISRRNKEKQILDILRVINSYPNLEVQDESIEMGINKAETEQGFELYNFQKDIVTKALNGNVVLITGNAGSSKTTTSRALLSIYDAQNYSISCCAFSAKAAQRITEATGFPASTIHRLLGYNTQNGFNHNHENPLDADVILIDECSMINVPIFLSLLQAVKEGAKVIMCGDNAQLPPIGYGNVFSDLLQREDDFNICRLTKVIRQAEDSGILHDANMVRVGKMPIKQPELKLTTGILQDMTYMFRDSREALQKIAINTYLKVVNDVGVDNISIVVPRREKCDNSSLEISKVLNEELNTDKTKCVQIGERKYYIGTKVMQIENNYEKNVFNGEIGYIKYIDDYTKGNEKITEITVDFLMNDEHKEVVYNKKEMIQLDLAYAMTVHKMQGSACHTVIVIIDMTHYALLDACMLYTALTRAKKRCLLLAEPIAFKKCIENNKVKERQTWLKNI